MTIEQQLIECQQDIRIECCRYAGINVVPDGTMFIEAFECLYSVPKGLTQQWIASNIERMATFGVKARKVRL